MRFPSLSPEGEPAPLGSTPGTFWVASRKGPPCQYRGTAGFVIENPDRSVETLCPGLGAVNPAAATVAATAGYDPVAWVAADQARPSDVGEESIRVTKP